MVQGVNYKLVNDIYFDYLTVSDTESTAVTSGTAYNTAVFGGQAGPADITRAGGPRPLGKVGQNANVIEWEEIRFGVSVRCTKRVSLTPPGSFTPVQIQGESSNCLEETVNAHKLSIFPTFKCRYLGKRQLDRLRSIMVQTNRLKRQFLNEVRDSVDRWVPQLEATFGVSLGKVVVRELRLVSFLMLCRQRALDALLRRREQKTGRRCSIVVRTMYATGCWLLVLPAGLYCWLRLHVTRLWKWDDTGRCIYIAFHGWEEDDYQANAVTIDNKVVHELSHGLWYRLGGKEEEDELPGWMMWNEGFSHYIADKVMGDTYAVQNIARYSDSSERLRGIEAIAELVNELGVDVIKRIPSEWRYFAKT